ncbi:MAG: ABC transporter substrate-binding protein [Ardenticatenaceae bacterium]|nr:ABC transporter substrate-binding protein [Ardenticatenaceae bacterium]
MRKLLFVLVVVSSVILSACTTTATPASVAERTPEVGKESTAEVVQATTEPVEEPTTKPEEEATTEPTGAQELVIGISALSPSLDAGVACTMLSWSMLRFINDPLVYTDWDMQTIRPWLAESWKQLDERTWQFKLRKGVTFHNGEPVDAEAVRYSLLRYQEKQLCMSFHLGKTFIEDVEIVDPYTVNIITTEPMWTVLDTLTFIDILPPKAAESEEFATHPVGSGPYRVVSYTPQEQLVLERNDEYWAYDPKYERVVIRIIAEESTRAAALEAGEVQLINLVPVDSIERLDALPNVSVRTVPSNRPISVGVNMAKDTPFSRDVRLRQAIAYGIDREAIAETILGGVAQPLPNYAIPPALKYAVEMPSYAYDPERARELVAEAGFKDGISCVFGSPLGSYLKDREVGQVLVEQLRNIGIDCELVQAESGIFIPEARKGADSQYDLTFLSLSPASLGIDYALSVLYTQDPYIGVSNEEVSKPWEEARHTFDEGKRAELYRTAQEAAWKWLPLIHVYQQPELHAAVDSLDFEARPDEWMYLKDRFAITK